MKLIIEWPDFEKLDIRVGTIVDAQEFPEAKLPAYKLWVDFGQEIGIKKSSAQITDSYLVKDLTDNQVVAIVNFPPKQIGPFLSECLVLGVYDEHKQVVLLRPQTRVTNGSVVG